MASALFGATMRNTTDFPVFPVVSSKKSLALFGDSKRCARRCAKTWAGMRRVACVFGLALMCFPAAWAQNASAQDQNDSLFGLPSRQHLFGDWGGERTALAEKGLTFDFFYITDLEGNPTGGPDQAQAGWMRVRGTMDLNFNRLISWQGLSVHATGLWQSGANLGVKIGTLANPSDLVSAHTTRLDSFWLQQLFFNNRLRIRAGQLAGLDFYGNQEYGGSWLIEPMGYAFGTLFRSIY